MQSAARIILLMLCGWQLLGTQHTAVAHPAHTSFAELDWNESGEMIEVALRIIPEDLETVLSIRTRESVALQDTPAQRKLISAWLAENFIVRDAAGNSGVIEMAGMELAYDRTWLYFTVAIERRAGLSLENRIFQDLATRREYVQLNQVQRLWRPPHDRLQFMASALVEQLY